MDEKRTRSQREFLSRTDMEQRVCHMLDYVLPNREDDGSPPNLQRVVAQLQSQYRVRFIFSEDLGKLATGERIFGMFAVAPLTIRVAAQLPQRSPTFRRTLAHELGHLVLHR